jgi:hypothetical protein
VFSSSPYELVGHPATVGPRFQLDVKSPTVHVAPVRYSVRQSHDTAFWEITCVLSAPFTVPMDISPGCPAGHQTLAHPGRGDPAPHECPQPGKRRGSPSPKESPRQHSPYALSLAAAGRARKPYEFATGLQTACSLQFPVKMSARRHSARGCIRQTPVSPGIPLAKCRTISQALIRPCRGKSGTARASVNQE